MLRPHRAPVDELILTRDEIFKKSLNAYQQGMYRTFPSLPLIHPLTMCVLVVARGGKPIVICNPNDAEFSTSEALKIEIPHTICE